MGKSNERILCKLSNGEILRLYLIVHVAMETTKTSNSTCQSKLFISVFFTCQVSACELQPFSCHDWQMTHTHKLPKLCSDTLTGPGRSWKAEKRQDQRPLPAPPDPDLLGQLHAPVVRSFKRWVAHYPCHTSSETQGQLVGFIKCSW